jgi:beta-N-acetylhexosaminidase
VIGNRALDQQANIVAILGQAIMRGLKRAGMSAVGKHFPGHGAVIEDSHHAIPVDKRDWDSIQNQDLVPFAKMISAGLPAVMPAHVIYEQLDDQAAGFSTFWLQTVLRQQLNFDGVIFSDDLSMEGATAAGNISERAEKALQAGCDILLICNDREAVLEVLPSLQGYENSASQARLQRLSGQAAPDWDTLHSSHVFKISQQLLNDLA